MQQTDMVSSAVAIVATTHGKAYIAPNSTLTEATMEALRWLAEALGVAVPEALRQIDLVALYSIARKNPNTALAVAAKRFGAETDDGIDLIPTPEPSPVPDPVTPTPAPPRTAPAPKDEPARLSDGTPTHSITARVLLYARARVNTYLYGPAGSGKTTMASHVAKELGLPVYATGAVDSAHTLLGYIAPGTGQYVRTAFREAFENGGVFLFDEVDGSDATAIVGLNQAVANNWFTFPDGVVAKHTDFVLLAAANTVGTGANRQYVGRNQLDGATLDRFARLAMDYDEKLERFTAPNLNWCKYVQAVRKAIADNGINAIVSPRATYDGAAVIAMGETWEGASETKIFAGMKPDDVARIQRAAPMKDFHNG